MDERTRAYLYRIGTALIPLLILHGDAHMIAADDGTNSQYADGASDPGPPVVCFAPMDCNNSTKGDPYTEGTYTGERYQYGLLEFTDNGDVVEVTVRGFEVDAEATEPSEDEVMTFVHQFDADDSEPVDGTWREAAVKVLVPN